MSKKKIIQEFINLLVKSLRHKIGSIVNKEEIYAQKYAKDAETLFNEAKLIISGQSFNFQDKEKIKILLKARLKKELEDKTFLDIKKFELIDKEVDNALKELNLD